MDGVPSRVQQSTYRRVVNRPAPVHRKPDEPQPVSVEPKATHRSIAPNQVVQSERSLRRFLVPIAIAVTVFVVVVGGFFAWSKMNTNLGIAIDETKYQAVFFTNGQVYFGKLQYLNSESMKLTEVFYLQAPATAQADPENPQATTSDQNNVQLIKLGEEVHGPEDSMIISKQQVLFYENLKPEGKVAQSIEKFKKEN